MNRADTELFEQIESDWVNYFSKCVSRDEIPLQGEHLNGKLVDYEGDLPQSGAYKPDMMPSIIDSYRKFKITHNEAFSARMMFKLPSQLQDFVMFEPVIRNQGIKREIILPNGQKTYEIIKPTQVIIAASCKCTVDQYKKRRGKAKVWLVEIVRQHTVIKIIKQSA